MIGGLADSVLATFIVFCRIGGCLMLVPGFSSVNIPVQVRLFVAIVTTFARRPAFGYLPLVLSLIATGFLSFGLWVHHMFTTGLPKMSLSFFSAASTAVAVPSGIQVFAWIATIASGRMKLTTPSLFVIGFLFIFTLGGLTLSLIHN